MNYIDIFTDASFCDQNKIGTYGFVIRTQKLRVERSGHFKRTAQTSLEVEIMAIGNAIAFAMLLGIVNVGFINIYSDCTGAIERIKLKSQCSVGKHVAKLLRDFRNQVAYNRTVLPKYEIKHIKAHTNKTDLNSIENKRCHELAKTELNRIRKNLRITF